MICRCMCVYYQSSTLRHYALPDKLLQRVPNLLQVPSALFRVCKADDVLLLDLQDSVALAFGVRCRFLCSFSDSDNLLTDLLDNFHLTLCFLALTWDATTWWKSLEG